MKSNPINLLSDHEGFQDYLKFRQKVVHWELFHLGENLTGDNL